MDAREVSIRVFAAAHSSYSAPSADVGMAEPCPQTRLCHGRRWHERSASWHQRGLTVTGQIFTCAGILLSGVDALKR
jgi:hypothetical protein